MSEFNISTKQYNFITDTSSEVLAWGGIRASKSYAALVKCLMLSRVPDNRIALCRKTLRSFKNTTLKMLIDGDPQTPPILKQGTYKHNKSDGIISFPAFNSEFIYFSMEDPTRVKGLTVSSVYIDELTDLTFTDYTTLLGRISAKINNQPMQLFATCNPQSASHWVAKRFGITGCTYIKENATKGCSAHLFLAKDNSSLSREYLEALELRTGLDYERDVLGKWVSSNGIIYPMFSRQVHLVERGTTVNGEFVEEVFKKYVIGVDTGFRSKNGILLAGVDNDNNIHVIREHSQSDMDEEEHANIVRQMVQSVQGRVEAVVIDYAGMGCSLREKLNKVGINAINAEKTISLGIAKVRNRLAYNAKSKPTLTFDPTCTSLIKEIENYEYKGDSEVPKDVNDHCLDALKYICTYLNTDIGDIIVTDQMIKDKKVQDSEKLKLITADGCVLSNSTKVHPWLSFEDDDD